MSQQINDNFQLLAGLPLDDRNAKPTIAERDAISSNRRFQGLWCFVVQTQTLYQLQGGVLNTNWVGIAGANVSNALESIIDGFYVLLAGKTTPLDFEAGDKFRGWIGNRYLVGTILTLPVSLPSDIDNPAKVELSVDSDDIYNNDFDISTISEIRSLSGILPSNNFYTTDLGKEGAWYYDASDTTSADNTGTVLVTADGKRIKRVVGMYVYPEWFGAIGDGVEDDSAAIQAAKDTELGVYLQLGKSYLAPGVTPFGNGYSYGEGAIIVEAPEGGYKQVNFYNDVTRRIDSGQEYLTYWISKVLTGTSKIIFSGDSTTAGAGVPGDENLPYIFNRMLFNDGIAGVTVVNSGHSGESTESWNTTRLATDMAQNPDLYIIRWGINDNDPLVFNASLREGLQKIRETYSKTLSDISIVLMTPNSISNSENGNDEEWIRTITPYIRQAARDYNCMYIDTYSLFTDSRAGKDIYFDDIGVHPKYQINNLIASHIYDAIIPTHIKILGSSSRLLNDPIGIADASITPGSFKNGITIARTDNTFPYDGWVTINKHIGSGVGTMQTNYSYSSTSDYAVRTSLNGTTWNPWIYSSLEAKYNSLLLGDLTATRITKLDVLDINRTVGGNGNVTIRSTDTAAADKGGFLTFGGSYSGTDRTVFGGIAGRKETGTTGQIGGYLAFSTSEDGVGNSEVGRFTSLGVLRIKNLITASVDEILISDTSGNVKKGGAAPASASYTPTVTASTNVTSATLSTASYTKIGNIVTGSIAINMQATAINLLSEITITVPVNRAAVVPNYYVGNGTYLTDIAFGAGNAFFSGSSTNTITLRFNSGASVASAGNCVFTFQYDITK